MSLCATGDAAAHRFAREFLVEPDLFPARAAGEPWGEESLAIDLAGGPYELRGLDQAQKLVLARRFGVLALEATLAAAGETRTSSPVAIRMFAVPGEEFHPVEQPGWRVRFDLDCDDQSVRVAGAGLMARLDGYPLPVVAAWIVGAEQPGFEGRVENLLRIVVAHRALALGGVLLHSAAVRLGEVAYLFFGPSGAGKSTLSRLSAERGLEVLSDELNVVLPGADGLYLERLPFAGDFGRDQEPSPRLRLPLAGWFSLAQGETASRGALPRGLALARLACCCPFVNGNGSRQEELLLVLDRLTCAVPIEELTFALDPSFWDILAT